MVFSQGARIASLEAVSIMVTTRGMSGLRRDDRQCLPVHSRSPHPFIGK